jgi:hypothetical protein
MNEINLRVGIVSMGILIRDTRPKPKSITSELSLPNDAGHTGHHIQE